MSPWETILRVVRSQSGSVMAPAGSGRKAQPAACAVERYVVWETCDIHLYLHIYIHTCTLYTHACVRACVRACERTYVHTNTSMWCICMWVIAYTYHTYAFVHVFSTGSVLSGSQGHATSPPRVCRIPLVGRLDRSTPPIFEQFFFHLPKQKHLPPPREKQEKGRSATSRMGDGERARS